MTRTKIVCTIGPACRNYSVIEAMVRAGMDVARLNFSHGTAAEHEESLRLLRRASTKLARPVAILVDLPGPKIRLGPLHGKTLSISKGDLITFGGGKVSSFGDALTIPTTYRRFARDVKVGHRILIADGKIALQAVEAKPHAILARVIVGGELAERQGVNLPDSTISSPMLTQRDKKVLAWAIKRGVDYVACSFVRREEDITSAQRVLRRAKRKIGLIAKIEKPEALRHLTGIVRLADAVMVARGDLGVEMPLEEVPFWQKKIIRLCHRENKPVITATQMLESMTKGATPTRAEVSDVANAIFDGTDAVMLSGETAVGTHPVEAVKWMDRIAREAESHLVTEWQEKESLSRVEGPLYHRLALALSHGTRELSRVLDVKLIIVYTLSGLTALYLSKRRIAHPILSISPDPATIRQMCLYWGVEPLFYRGRGRAPEEVLSRVSHETLFEFAENFAAREHLVRKGDLILLVAGRPLGKTPLANVIRIATV